MKYFNIILAAFLLISCSHKNSTNNSGAKAQNIAYSVPDSINIVEATGKIMPLSGVLEIKADKAAKVEKILVKTGEAVSKNQTLIVLDNKADKIKLQEIQSQLNEAKAKLVQAENNMEADKVNSQYLQNKLQQAENLFKKSAINQDNLQEMQNKSKLADIKLKQDSANIQALKAQLNSVKENLAMAKLDLENTLIKAPSAGRILSVNVQEAENIPANSSLISFAKNENLVVDAQLDELFASKVKLGQKVDIKLIGYNKTIATGKIYSMDYVLKAKSLFSGLENEKQDSQCRSIKILLDKQANQPLIGTKVNCEIHLN